jgi:hypothetical protein
LNKQEHGKQIFKFKLTRKNHNPMHYNPLANVNEILKSENMLETRNTSGDFTGTTKVQRKT